jgi:PAS domain S-box-containing protein
MDSSLDLAQILIDLLPDALFFKDLEGRYWVNNLAQVHALGAGTVAATIGKTDFDFLPISEATRLRAEDQAVMTSGSPLERLASSVDLPSGQTRWFQTTKVAGRDGAGKVIGLAGIVREIPADQLGAWERDHATSADANVLLEALLNNVPDRIYFKDPQSRFLKVNPALARRMGVADSSLIIGKSDADFMAPEKAREFQQDEQRILETGVPLINKIEKQILPGGEVAWTSTTKVPARDKMGTIIGLVGINRDMTQQIRAEEALRQSRDELEQLVAQRTADLAQTNLALQKQIQERDAIQAELARNHQMLRTLVDHLPDGIYAKDIGCRKTLANPADLKSLRCHHEADAIGKTDFDLFPRELAEKFWADDQAVIHGQPVLNREEYFFDDAGQQHWLLTSKLPLRNAAGDIVGLVGIGRDITPLKEAQLKLEAAHTELVEASWAAGMAEVASGVLHNVGNVLNSVNVSVSVIGDSLRKSRLPNLAKLSAMFQEHAGDLGGFLVADERGRKALPYLSQLTQHLQQEQNFLAAEVGNLVSKIEHIKAIVAAQQNYASASAVVQPIDLRELVEDALKIYGAAFERHGVTVVREYDSLPTVTLDKHKVLQILVNLIQNAKYACEADHQPAKQVTLRLKGAEKRLQIQVADNGIGIPPENLARIFSHGFTTRKGGHGFGLHSAALAAHAVGGSLTVASEGAGKGATFTLELPLLLPPVGNETPQT